MMFEAVGAGVPQGVRRPGVAAGGHDWPAESMGTADGVSRIVVAEAGQRGSCVQLQLER